MSSTRRAIAALVAVVAIMLAVALLVGASTYHFGAYRAGSMPNSIPGQPTKDPATGLYTVYVMVLGHRDRTPVHFDLHASVRIDSVSVYFANPGAQPSGDTWGGFDKSVAVTVSITGGSLSAPIVSTFAFRSVALGASWGQVITFSLPSGGYTVTASGMDQGGYRGSASTTLTLP